MENPIYQMMIRNIVNYLANMKEEMQKAGKELDYSNSINAFQMSEVIGVALGKRKEDVMDDILSLAMKLERKSHEKNK